MRDRAALLGSKIRAEDGIARAVAVVQPECMDLAEIKRTFGKELVLWGYVPAQRVFAPGSAADVRRHLKFLMDEIAVDRAMVLKFTNWLSTERLLANLRTFLECFYEMGKYEGGTQ